jgi:hypothetical protein
LVGKEYFTCKIDNNLTVGLDAFVYSQINTNGWFEIEFINEKGNKAFNDFNENGYFWTEGSD